MGITAGVGALIGGVAAAGGTIASGVMGSNAANSAAQLQYQSTQDALNFQKQQYATQQAQMAPYLASGQSNLNTLNADMPALTAGFNPQSDGLQSQFNPTNYGLPSQFNYNATNFQVDPGYQFALQQGQQAIQRSALAGSGLSGGTLKDLTAYTTGQAAQQYGAAYQRAQGTYQQNYGNALGAYQQNYSNAFNTYNSNQSNTYNRLAAQAGQGLSATGMANQASQNYANQAGNYTIQGANALAAGQVGSANALGTSLSGTVTGASNAYNNYQNNQAMQNILGASQYGSSVNTNVPGLNNTVLNGYGSANQQYGGLD
jgi:hypothetical protein